MKRHLALPPLALAMMLVGCGEKDPILPDATPPGRVTDLRVKSARTNIVTLRWTTPGDNGRQGTAKYYQVRWSTDWITESNFASAHPIQDPPTPAMPGTIELFSVPNMDITQVIHFALRTFDEVGLASPVSNDAQWTPAGFPVQYTKDLPVSQDNTMYAESDNLSNGAGQYLFAGRNSDGSLRRALLAFSLVDSIPADAVVDSVRLTLTMNSLVTGIRAVSLHTAEADWGEGTSDAAGDEAAGAQAQTNDATWGYRRFNTDAWTTAGGDYDSTASAQTSVGASGAYSWSSRLMKDDVQHWLDIPDSNFGWVVIGDESGSLSEKRFYAREHATAAYRPRLKVYYTVMP